MIYDNFINFCERCPYWTGVCKLAEKKGKQETGALYMPGMPPIGIPPMPPPGIIL
jgi:hypothetical protein